MRKLLRDENAQATTEYILMLSIILVLLIGLIKKLIQPVLARLGDMITAQFQSYIFGADLHQIKRH